MEPQDRTYPTADGSALPLRLWRSDRPRAALVYLHGIQSHSGWYEASSQRLAEAGVAVYQVERRGSGIDCAHERGHVDRAETWLDDVAAAAELARAETGLGTVHLVGVSWGGKLAPACAAHRPDLYRSLILAAPGIVPLVDVTLATKLRIGQSLLVGRSRRRVPI
ncbi:MAG TPA: alpha/beta fold hydrolase, partial [Phycisphaerae bacterium]|nr:alpha/beta fold hydrolase [Phycisphaerae bacterium]